MFGLQYLQEYINTAFISRMAAVKTVNLCQKIQSLIKETHRTYFVWQLSYLASRKAGQLHGSQQIFTLLYCSLGTVCLCSDSKDVSGCCSLWLKKKVSAAAAHAGVLMRGLLIKLLTLDSKLLYLLQALAAQCKNNWLSIAMQRGRTIV